MQSLTTAIVIKQWGTPRTEPIPPSSPLHLPSASSFVFAHDKVISLIRSCSQLLTRQTPGGPEPEWGGLGKVLWSQSLNSVWTTEQRKMASQCCYYDDVLQ